MAARRPSSPKSRAPKSPPTFGGVIETVADLGALVREARLETGYSQLEFGDLAGAGRRFVSEVENGKETVAFGLTLKVLNAAGWDLVARKR